MTLFDGLVRGGSRRPRDGWLLRGSLAILALAGTAQAQIQAGDILLTLGGTNARVTRFHPDGSHVWTTSGATGWDWVGCAITPHGHVITTRRFPSKGFNVFDSNGVQIASFDTPQVWDPPGDVSVFADGMLAVTDQSGGADLYTEAGVYVTSFAPATWGKPFGSFVDSSDNLWLCDGYFRLHKFNRAGVVLATIPLGFQPGDLVVAPDGTLWVSSVMNGRVMHLAPDGSVLGFFPTSVAGAFFGIALAGDGSLFVIGQLSLAIHHYSSAGSLLGTIPLGLSPIGPMFLTLSGCGTEPVAYCTAKTNSLGCTPAIGSTGFPSASMTSGFVVHGANVRNNKNGVLFYGTSGPTALPFQGGTLCVKSPLRRTGGTNSGGAPFPANDCSGVFSIDMNAFAHSAGPPLPLPALTVPGTKVDCQWWGRDPGFTAPNNTTLSNGLEYTVCP